MDPLVIAGTSYRSRLLVGTGKFDNANIAREAIAASGAEIATVAVRRIALEAPQPAIEAVIDPNRITYLPNSAGCYTAADAVRTLRLARALGGWNLVKLEVIADRATLYPNSEETLIAAKQLVSEGFAVMVYTTDDAALARALEAAGVAAIMPLAAPIGSGAGILHPENIRTIVAQSRVPVLVDAGIGTASDAAIAMELGCDGVLLNTAIAKARDPVRMAAAMKHAVIAGREAYLAGRMEKREGASPSSPEKGVLPTLTGT